MKEDPPVEHVIVVRRDAAPVSAEFRDHAGVETRGRRVEGRHASDGRRFRLRHRPQELRRFTEPKASTLRHIHFNMDKFLWDGSGHASRTE
ncbi:hypothetical protein V2I01_21710 [Micromonospora sp. BRA006-A]|nr:hypothetical protein [Micromonospora sp. BRA006-A]